MRIEDFISVSDVAAYRLCMGCGACAWRCANQAIVLEDIPDMGIRPIVDLQKCRSCGECLEICPGTELIHTENDRRAIPELQKTWGQILEVWEGYAADSEIRFKGSSGGAASALALYGVDQGLAEGALQAGADQKVPWKNGVYYNKDRNSIVSCTGSRYSPAAVCQHFDEILKSPGKSIFIGKPCDVAALKKAQLHNAELKEKVALTISIFCAGTPSTAGTEALIEKLGVQADQIQHFRYRGHGWPGKTCAQTKDQASKQYEMTYEQSWGQILSNYGQIRCRLCPDSTGEFADISCGDPWYRDIQEDEAGYSLILARTQEGADFLKQATEARYLYLQQAEHNILQLSQKALHRRRKHLWGRLLAMKWLLVPTPKYKHDQFFLYENWRTLPLGEKLRSVVGTVKRIVQRKWTRPLKKFSSR